MSDQARVWSPLDSIPTIGNYSSVVTQRFVATAAQQLFTLTKFAYTAGTYSIMVFQNGSLLITEFDYLETDGSSFTLTVGATVDDVILAVGFIGSIQAVVDPYYLGPKAAGPTEDNQGVTLAAGHEGYTYWNTTTDNFWIWTGSIWELQASSIATSANLVPISDAGGYYTGAEVETALQELGAATGAAIIGVEDSAANFAGTNVEAVLAEIIADYAAVTAGNGASKVGIEDSAGNIVATTVEGALAELALKPCFSVHKNGTAQNNITGIDTLTWSTEDYDSNSDFAANVHTPTVAGKYHYSVQVSWLSVTSGDFLAIFIYKNGTAIKKASVSSGVSGDTLPIAVDVEMNGTTDYIDIRVENEARDTSGISGASTLTFWTGHLVSRS